MNIKALALVSLTFFQYYITVSNARADADDPASVSEVSQSATVQPSENDAANAPSAPVWRIHSPVQVAREARVQTQVLQALKDAAQVSIQDVRAAYAGPEDPFNRQRSQAKRALAIRQELYRNLVAYLNEKAPRRTNDANPYRQRQVGRDQYRALADRLAKLKDPNRRQVDLHREYAGLHTPQNQRIVGQISVTELETGEMDMIRKTMQGLAQFADEAPVGAVVGAAAGTVSSGGR